MEIQPNFIDIESEKKFEPKKDKNIERLNAYLEYMKANTDNVQSHSNISRSANGSIVKGGSLQSPCFKTGVSGWQITSEGNAEFNDGTFRGTLQVAGVSKTVDAIADLQTALDDVDADGGGVVWLKAGTYTLTADITVPSGVTLAGVSRDDCIIECGAYKVKVLGTNAYTDGTVAINDGSDTVTGTLTSFTSAMEGRYIMLSGLWWLIDTVNSGTELVLSTTYSGDNITADSTIIAAVNFASTIRKLTLQNATGAALQLQYDQETWLDDLIIYTSGTGIDIDDDVYLRMTVAVYECTLGIDMDNVWGSRVDFSASSFNTGNGLDMNNCGAMTVVDSAFEGNGGDGISLTNCKNVGVMSTNSFDNTDNGLELVSNCNDMQFFAFACDDNGGDGVKLTATSSRNIFTGFTASGNGGYGINIADSSCEKNIVVACFTTINDLGVNTVQSANTN